jgi:heme exporter protein A
MIEIRGVAKYFGRFSALRKLDLAVGRGEFVALFGRNGAGKTTLLRILAGLTSASAGNVVIACPEPRSPRDARGRVGYLAHSTVLYGDLTALENLKFFARLYDLEGGDDTLSARLAAAGLAGREHDPVRNYSRGMQQRLAIVRAFLHDPDILLLDEPFTGLDRQGTEFLKRHLLAAHERGKTCVMAIHDAALGWELATRLVVIEKGGVGLDAARADLSLDEFQRRYDALQESHAR